MARVEPVTEQREARHADLDLRSTLELVELINDEDARVAPAVRAAAPALAAAIDAIVERLERGGRLVYVGAGTSGGSRPSTRPSAAHLRPHGGPRRRARTRPDEEAREDDAGGGAAAVADAGVGRGRGRALSASGSTPYTVGAARAAADAGALLVAVLRPRLGARESWPSTRSSP